VGSAVVGASTGGGGCCPSTSMESAIFSRKGGFRPEEPPSRKIKASFFSPNANGLFEMARELRLVFYPYPRAKDRDAGTYSKLQGRKNGATTVVAPFAGTGIQGQHQKQAGDSAGIITTCAEISTCAHSTLKRSLAKKWTIPVAGATAYEGFPFQKIKLIWMRAGAHACTGKDKLDNAHNMIRWEDFVQCVRAPLFWVPRGNGEPKGLVDWLPTTTRFPAL